MAHRALWFHLWRRLDDPLLSLQIDVFRLWRAESPRALAWNACRHFQLRNSCQLCQICPDHIHVRIMQVLGLSEFGRNSQQLALRIEEHFDGWYGLSSVEKKKGHFNFSTLKVLSKHYWALSICHVHCSWKVYRSIFFHECFEKGSYTCWFSSHHSLICTLLPSSDHFIVDCFMYTAEFISYGVLSNTV